MITFEENGHIYRDDAGVQIPSVTQIIKAAGLMGDMSFYDDYSRDRGSKVHLATALHDRGTLDETTVAPEIEPYLAGWIRFREESEFEPVEIEKMVHNIVYGYVGTLDRTGTMHGRDVLIDIKTGAAQPWAGIQTAAYNECYDDQFDKPYNRYAVELRGDGKYKLTSFTDRNDWSVFLSALAIVNWKKNKGVK